MKFERCTQVNMEEIKFSSVLEIKKEIMLQDIN